MLSSPPPPTLICIPFDLQANEAQLKETSSSLSSSNLRLSVTSHVSSSSGDSWSCRHSSRNAVTISKNSCGFSACGQCPLSGINLMPALGNNLWMAG